MLESGALLTGVALAAFHTASLVGRLVFSRAASERLVLTIAGLLASAAMAVVVVAGAPAVAAAGLLVVGFALAPVVPTALSLAGRNAPGRSATAVSLVTTVGYSAFVLGPPVVGLLAELTSLRTALIPVVASTAAIALLARWVRSKSVTRELVFGYGSLPAEEAGVECRLHDHDLGWDVAMDNREVVPGYKVYVDPQTGLRPAVEVAYVSIAPQPGASVDGVAFPVSDARLAELDRAGAQLRPPRRDRPRRCRPRRADLGLRRQRRGAAAAGPWAPSRHRRRLARLPREGRRPDRPAGADATPV